MIINFLFDGVIKPFDYINIQTEKERRIISLEKTSKSSRMLTISNSKEIRIFQDNIWQDRGVWLFEMFASLDFISNYVFETERLPISYEFWTDHFGDSIDINIEDSIICTPVAMRRWKVAAFIQAFSLNFMSIIPTYVIFRATDHWASLMMGLLICILFSCFYFLKAKSMLKFLKKHMKK